MAGSAAGLTGRVQQGYAAIADMKQTRTSNTAQSAGTVYKSDRCIRKTVACMTTVFQNECDILTLTNKHKGGCAMYGAILGDIIGSPYEFDMGDKTKDFPLR